MIENQDTRIRFEKIMNTFAEIFGHSTTKKKNRIYFSFLKDLSIDEIETAAEGIIKEKRISTFPTPGEIREKIFSDEQMEVSGLELWNKANELIILGVRESGDQLLDQTIELAFGSWRQFGETDPKDEPFDRRHFVGCYKSIVKKEMGRILPRGNILDELNEAREKIKKLEGDKK